MNFFHSIFMGMAVGLLVAFPIVFSIAVLPWLCRRRRFAEIGSKINRPDAFSVRYCTGPRYEKLLKIFPWEGLGLVGMDDGMVVFDVFPNEGKAFQVKVKPDAMRPHGRPT